MGRVQSRQDSFPRYGAFSPCSIGHANHAFASSCPFRNPSLAFSSQIVQDLHYYPFLGTAPRCPTHSRSSRQPHRSKLPRPQLHHHQNSRSRFPARIIHANTLERSRRRAAVRLDVAGQFRARH
ncbi:hypothetical protein BDU57DRAFT_168955 [Ampelomyces quisqualis]|uniref:Uncharacterized protein n=1 Tax=Ampelomyces quisqualis TaxID=50730 RepID=A0A6A5QRP5_AMPQU|nr:hypothetical protein BDU57DRAFT_168955 [Ampelomyces quisqualis]